MKYFHRHHVSFLHGLAFQSSCYLLTYVYDTIMGFQGFAVLFMYSYTYMFTLNVMYYEMS